MLQYTRKSLSKELGIGIETLRYYENLDLIPTPARASNGYRIYTEEDVSIINHILIAKKHGFTLKEIKTIIELSKNTEFQKEDMKPFFQNKIQDIDNQIQELNKLKSLLLKLIQKY